MANTLFHCPTVALSRRRIEHIVVVVVKYWESSHVGRFFVWTTTRFLRGMRHHLRQGQAPTGEWTSAILWTGLQSQISRRYYVNKRKSISLRFAFATLLCLYAPVVACEVSTMLFNIVHKYPGGGRGMVQ